ncbi:MAG: alpha/beta hydrolase [Alphaproteobacteria bacterium]|nr:alpha/beta hydrolase [Alphaproteobacteria bacterium]
MTQMAPLPFLENGPSNAPWRLILAHGAGAPMDSAVMTAIAEAIAEQGVSVSRFEFPYMQTRRRDGGKRPPDRAPKLIAAWREALAAVVSNQPGQRIAIGGKSMGGRMATLLAAEPDAPEEIEAIVTLGYPFHPPGKPDRLRVDHFPALAGVPILMVQGTRDPFGGDEEVSSYRLPDLARLHWVSDGNHDLKPRKASGLTHAEVIVDLAKSISVFLNGL